MRAPALIVTALAIGAGHLAAQCPEDEPNLARLPALAMSSELRASLDSATRSGTTVCRAYRLLLNARTAIQIDLASSDFDAYLILRDSSRSLEARNDDGGGYPNARLVVALEPGVYRVIVTSYSRSSTGAFVLRAAPPADSVAVTDSLRAPQIIARATTLAVLSAPSATVCRPANGDVPTAGFRDPAHPSYFFRVVERFGGRDRALYAVARLSDGTLQPRIRDAEVDRHSDLVVQFDAAYIDDVVRHQAAFDFSIRTFVQGADGSTREVETPGYALIGEQRKRVGARLSMRATRQTVCGLIDNLRFTFTMDDLVIHRRSIDSALAELLALDRNVMALIADRLGTSTVVIHELARRIQDILRGPTAIAPEQHVVLRRLALSLADYLRNFKDGDMEAGLISIARVTFRETHIPVAASGAHVGERMVIVLANDASGDSVPRTTRLEYEVVEFGARAVITASPMLVLRLGASGAAVAAAQSGVAAAPVGGTRDVATPYEFDITPSTGLLWRYYPRGDGNSDGVGSGTRFWRWLRPAIGVAVTFPRFGTTRHTLVSRTATDTAVSSTEDVQGFQVGVGLMAAAFDQAIQFTVGVNLSSIRRRPMYFGIGLSFGTIVERLNGGESP